MPAHDLVLCDIDGCLTPENPVVIDRRHLSLIAERNERAAAQGLAPVTLCTGRPQPFAELLCRLLANTTVPCIAENGVWLYHPGTNAYAMDPSITADHLRLVTELEGRLRADYGRFSAAIQPGKTASLSLYHHDHDWLVGVRDQIAALVQSRGWPLRVSMSWFYINCDLIHISKASGIRRLLEQHPHSRERLAGIGDTLGDLAIADSVGWFGCPANADERLKPRAHLVAKSHETAGVWELLQHLDGLG
ncbi:phosphoglycolate phosphatase [Planctomycetota bacterium]|nr:phosphoglycolate phosphatase [Planctomycetota bacterium]